jgi:hypothetical protein
VCILELLVHVAIEGIQMSFCMAFDFNHIPKISVDILIGVKILSCDFDASSRGLLMVPYIQRMRKEKRDKRSESMYHSRRAVARTKVISWSSGRLGGRQKSFQQVAASEWGICGYGTAKCSKLDVNGKQGILENSRQVHLDEWEVIFS